MTETFPPAPVDGAERAESYRYPCASGDLACPNSVPPGYLFCEEHWARLSAEMQGRVVGAYARFLQTMKAEDRAAWRAVRAEALEMARGGE